MVTIVLPTAEERGRRAPAHALANQQNNRGTMSNVARSSNLITRPNASDRRDRSTDHNLGCSLSALFLYFFSNEPSVDLSAFSWATMQQGESI